MMKMNLENTVEGGFEYEKRVWAARCKSEKGAVQRGQKIDGRKVLCQCEEETFFNVPCVQKKGEDLYSGYCYLYISNLDTVILRSSEGRKNFIWGETRKEY